MKILISHCNTEDCTNFGLSLFYTESKEHFSVNLSKAQLDKSNDVGLTGICQNEAFIYVGVQSVNGGKLLVFDKELSYRKTIELKLVEDLHSIDFSDNKIYCTSTRNNSVVSFDITSQKEELVWQHSRYIHLNDVKSHKGELYILSQDSLSDKNTGGTVTRLSDMSTIITGMNQPHSLYFSDDELYVLSSKAGEVKHISLANKQQATLAHIDGYARGIIAGDSGIYVAKSAERLHSRKQGKEKQFVTQFDDYLGNPIFESGIHCLNCSGEPSEYIDFTSINFEIYELFAITQEPASKNLIPSPQARKAQFFRKELNDAQQYITELNKQLESRNSIVETITDKPQPAISNKRELLKTIAARLPAFLRTPAGRLYRHYYWNKNYYAGAYYFSDAWPLNFWTNFHPSRAREELKAYKAMGFNTIFIAIPWSGFQPDPAKKHLNKDYLDRARQLFAICQKLKLKVITRISYNHCICDDSVVEPYQRIEHLLTDQAIYSNWISYITELKQLGNYSSAKLFFLCWEDFWHTFTAFQEADEQRRTELATAIGYQAYLEANYSLEEYNALRASSDNSYNQLKEIPIPNNSSEQHRCYLEFMNWRIRQLFNDCAKIIEPLTMEVRVDMDSYLDLDGNRQWFENDKYEDIGKPILTYWAPFMGAKNEGESLSADEAISSLNNMINRYQHSSQILNQFNFIDRTPEFQGIHAQIRDEEVASFLEKSTEILARRCAGFGLWAFRDYHQNLLINANFSLGTDGWSLEGGKIKSRMLFQKKPTIELLKGATLSQEFIPRLRGMGWIHNAKHLSLAITVRGEPTARLAMRASLEGHGDKLLEIRDGELTAQLDLNHQHRARDPLKLVIENLGDSCEITRVCLYHYTFDNDIVTSSGKQGKYFPSIKALAYSIKKNILSWH